MTQPGANSPPSEVAAILNAWTPLMLALLLAEDDPVAAVPVLEEARAAATASGMRSLRAMASFAEAELACSTGDLAVAIDVATDLMQHRSNPLWGGSVRLVSFAALLTEDEDVLRIAAEAAELGLRSSPGARAWADKPRHRLGLLHHHPSVANVDRDPPPPTCSTLWLMGRETIDAGAAMSPSISLAIGRYPNPTRAPSWPPSRLPPPATRTAGTTLSPSPSSRDFGSSPSTPSKVSP